MKLIIVFLLGLFAFEAGAKSDFERLFEKAKNEISNELSKGQFSDQLSALSDSDVVGALREALKVGAKAAASNASQVDGFFKNSRLFIPMPKELQTVEKFLNRMGMKKLSDDFVKSLNRGAEEAAHLALPVFAKSITKMSFQDAKSILSGKENAATEFLKRSCTPELTTAFIPVVDKSLKKVNATKYWKDISTTYNSVNFLKPIETDLNQYVTEKALDGLFLLIADEEKKIRKDPLGQASSLIRKVFSTVKEP